MRQRAIASLTVTSGLLLLVACGGEQAEPASEAAPEAPAEMTTTAASDMPEVSGPALWEHLQSADYRANWELWPGKGEKYEGTEPHGLLLTTYLNEVAYDAFTNAAGRMPADAIIVKENYMPDGTLAAITTMYKVEGYNAEAGDWHWVKFLADGSIDMDGMAQGKVAMCIGCHTGKADNDYVFTGSLSGEGD